MKAALFTVYYHTPEKYKKDILYHAERLGLYVHSLDVSQEQKGYATALNELIKANYTRYEIFFLANPDISLAGIIRDELLTASEYFDIWGYALKQNDLTYYGGELDKWRMSGGLISMKPKMRFQECDFISGSLMGVKKEVFNKIGYFDESFFMYYEDVEFCTRARNAEFKVGIDSEQWYEHFESSDTNPQKKKWLAKNRMKFLWQYGTILQKGYEILRLPKTIIEEGTNLL